MDEEMLDPGISLSLKDVSKSYGSGKSKQQVLTNFNMTVPRGTIYGLLGPSGCGKTTALRCAVGRLDVDGGMVSVLGNKPHTVKHGVPGYRVGYMPQELALYLDMTIFETLMYFGRLHKMSRSRVKERIAFLLEFLHLPPESQLIRKLSGGQQRRTSFAIALLQEPEILILDEPTVGVDPLLRQSIWGHLLELARNSHITIIITTHYIEEARQAHVVGLMRSGRLLAEAAPQQLMQTYRKQQLEDVFFELCLKDQDDDTHRAPAVELQNSRSNTEPVTSPKISVNSADQASNNSMPTAIGYHDHEADNYLSRDAGSPRNGLDNGLHQSTDDDLLMSEILYKPRKQQVTCRDRAGEWIPSGWNILALFFKQMTLMRRNIGAVIFMFFLPSFQIILFCLCVGRTPFDLKMAVVNVETNGSCHKPYCVAEGNYSCCFLQHLNKRTITQVNYNSRLDDALESTRRGDTWGVLEMRQNFSQALAARFLSPEPDNGTISDSEVHVYIDNTNQQISYTLQSEILNAMQHFIDDILEMLGQDPSKAQIPIQYEQPIYGELNPSFTNFMAPGIILSITFFMATGLTALVFVTERKQGLLDRSFVAGVSSVEVMIGHTVTQCVVMAGQVTLLLVFALAVFHVPYKGPLELVIILTLFQGLTGMALGLLISAVCDDELSAIQMSLGSVYPNMLLSGILWPLEGMPFALRAFSYSLPMTYASEAMRSVLSRGWDIAYLHVWRGVLMSIGWFTVLMLLAGLILKVRKN